jgi:hypothetical protein
MASSALIRIMARSLWSALRGVYWGNDVRFGFNSDRESGFPQRAMSASLLKADVCSATRHIA